MVSFLLWSCFLLLSLRAALPFEEDEDGESVGKKRQVNFASVSAGAVVLESSPKANGYHYLLNDDKDKYGISPCAEKKWLVIGLSEDIVVEEIVVANHEKFSSSLETFQILSSTSFPATDWIDLGTFLAAPELGEQIFQLHKPSWGRYLKFRFLTHHGDEFYCTLTQIKVHGSTVLENLKKEVERSSREVLDLESVILEEDDEDSTAPADNLSNRENAEGDVECAAVDPLSPATSAPILEDRSQDDSHTNSVQDLGDSLPSSNLTSPPVEFNSSLDIVSKHSPQVISETPSFQDLETVQVVISEPNSTFINSSVSESIETMSTVTESNSTDSSTSGDIAAPSNASENLPPIVYDTLSTPRQPFEVDSETLGDSLNSSTNEIPEAPLNGSNVKETISPLVVSRDSLEIIPEDLINVSLQTGDSMVNNEDMEESTDASKNLSTVDISVSTPPPAPSSISSSVPDSQIESSSPDPSPLPPTDVPLSSIPISKLKTCIDQLKFPEFQAKMRAKLAAGTHLLNQSSNASAAELNQDVFRSLMKKISSLEQNSKIIELYLLQVSECQILLSKELDSLRTQEANELQNATLHHLELNRTLEILLSLLPQEILETQHLADLPHEASYPHQESCREAQTSPPMEDSPEFVSFGDLVDRCFLTQFPPMESRVWSGSSDDVCIRLGVTFAFLSFLVSFLTFLLVTIALISRGRCS